MSQPYNILPELPYAYDSLEPYIDAKTMEIHYNKHHLGYVQKLKGALEKHPYLFDVPVDELLQNLKSVPEDIRAVVYNNAGGHANHSLFWSILKKNENGKPLGDLATALDGSFGSYETFRKEFQTAATSHFGSGWAWLSAAPLGNLVIQTTPNQHSPLVDGFQPIIGLDLWEHAYYLNYQNRRPDYVEAFWKIINWEQADKNFKVAQLKVKN